MARYQKKQNELISALLKPMDEHTLEAREEEDAARVPVGDFSFCVVGGLG